MTDTIAIVTGAAQGFGLALTTALAARGTTVVACARDAERLRAATAALPPDIASRVIALPGDITDAAFRTELVEAARRAGGTPRDTARSADGAARRAAGSPHDTAGTRLDLLVHNAGELGPSPLPPLERYPLDGLRAVLETTVVAALALTQLALPLLRSAASPAIVTLSSDAAVEAYPGWGGYGAAKAALDHLVAVLAVEEPGISVYAFDPGDMRTAMHQRAFPGEDISDRPEPETVVPAFLRLLDDRPAGVRHRAADLVGTTV